ncbi:MAG: helicase [Chloroflexi bacterium]|nr:MAG: helicase [Chloroflexota bacterium]RLC86737.1 MAG: helicase [Chloroflexota bacterium]HEY73934.1 helicase [Thermoflexia bacterium]
MRNIVAFDVETQYLADEVGGWGNIRGMGLAVAVTYHAAEDVYRDYTEEQVGDLIAALREADLVVGYNVLRFDYEVLRAYTDDPLADLPTVDMMRDLHQTLGWRPKLDGLAAATLGEGKSADGIQAVHWFRAGKLDQVIAYCRKDVEVTWGVYDFGRQNGYVQYHDRRRRVRKVPVRW